MADPKEFTIDSELMEKCFTSMEWFKYEILKKISRRLHHGDWATSKPQWLFESVEKEMKELEGIVEQFKMQEDKSGPEVLPYLFMIIDECTDVAFSSMMLADVCYKKILSIVGTQDKYIGGKNA